MLKTSVTHKENNKKKKTIYSSFHSTAKANKLQSILEPCVAAKVCFLDICLIKRSIKLEPSLKLANSIKL